MKNRYEVRGDDTAIFLTLNNGKVLETLILSKDFEKINKHPGTWHAHYNPSTDSYYVDSNEYSTGKQKYIRLHRLLLNAPRGLDVDHIDHNTLNNRRNNLRLATRSQNQQNMPLLQNSKSGIRGVTWNKVNKKWWLRVHIDGKRTSLGLFNALEEAKKAAIIARAKYLPYSQEAAKEVKV